MHSFYFVIESNPRQPNQKTCRVDQISKAATDLGESCHIEKHGQSITIQVDFSDDMTAMAFKMAVEPAVYEG